jgi:hypothetical protein
MLSHALTGDEAVSSIGERCSSLREMFRRLAQGAAATGALALVAFAWRCDEPWFERHVFLPQQYFISASRGIVFWSRATAAGSAVLLLLLVVFMPRGAAGRRLLAAVLLALPAAEALLQWRLRRLVNPGLAEAMDTLTTWNPRQGFTLTAGMDRLHPMSGRAIRFRTDADGRRISGAAIDPALPSLVFTGESTVAGIGLQWEETFAAILGTRLRLQVVNLGSPAYRIDQSWLRLKDALPKLDRPVAVIGLFMPGLVGRSFAGQRHPLARPSPSGAVELLPPERPGLLQRSGLYRLWKHLYWSDAAVDEGMRSVSVVLREIAALGKARGAPCIFLVTGRTPRWMLHDLFEAPGLDYVVAEVPEEALLADGHPGTQANIGIADALEPRLRTTIAGR